MKTSSTTISAILLTMAFLVALSAFGRDHNALNGTWTLVPEKSDFAGQPPLQSATVTINDREGNITLPAAWYMREPLAKPSFIAT